MQGEQDRNKSDMAIKWLRDHFADGPDIETAWNIVETPAPPAARQRLLELLFGEPS